MDGSSFRFDGRGKAPAVWENLLKEIEDTEEALQHADLEGQRVHTTQSLPRMNHTGDMTMMLGGDDGSQRACPSRNIHGRDAQPIYNTLNGRSHLHKLGSSHSTDESADNLARIRRPTTVTPVRS